MSHLCRTLDFNLSSQLLNNFRYSLCKMTTIEKLNLDDWKMTPIEKLNITDLKKSTVKIQTLFILWFPH